MNSVSLDKVNNKANSRFDTDLKRMKLIHRMSKYIQPHNENDKQRFSDHHRLKPTKKRLLLKPQKKLSFKRRKSEESDLDLDKAANEVSEVSEWRTVLEKWNVISEDLSLNYSYFEYQKRISA
jgi:hypothetical protein